MWPAEVVASRAEGRLRSDTGVMSVGSAPCGRKVVAGATSEPPDWGRKVVAAASSEPPDWGRKLVAATSSEPPDWGRSCVAGVASEALLSGREGITVVGGTYARDRKSTRLNSSH